MTGAPSVVLSPAAELTPDAQRGATRSSGPHLRFRADIEGLRAVAILLVVVYHAGWSRASGGFLGVDVFFVLSGFLITGLLLDEITTTGTVSLTRFWARRARRLLPAAAVITIVVVIGNALLLSPFEQIRDAETARMFAAYASNILFAIRSSDYFGDAATRDPLLHTWSLSVEEQFYLFFAPLLLALAVWSRKQGATVFRRRFIAATDVASVLSLAGCMILVRSYPVIAFFALPTRAWEFGLGALAVIGVRYVGQLRRTLLEVLALAGLVVLLASAALFRGEGAPLGAMTLVPTIGTVLLIITGASAEPTAVARLLSTAPLRLLGRLSYSWYLWHWPLLVYLREHVAEPSIELSMGVAMLSLLPAAVTYRWIESPVRFSKRFQQKPVVVVAGAVALAVITAALATGGISYARSTLASPRYAEIRAARQQARTYADGCQVDIPDVVSPECRYGPGTNDTTLVLFGDSHAAQWFPAFESIVTKRGWTLVNLTKRGCPSVEAAVYSDRLKRRYTECDTWRESAMARIATIKPTLIVVTNGKLYNIFVGAQHPRADSSAAARDVWRQGMIRTLSALRATGARILVLQDTPRPGFDVPRCLMLHIDDQSRCVLDAARERNPEIERSDAAAIRAVPDVSFGSMNAYICPSDSCSMLDSGSSKFRDDNHLAVRFAVSLAPQLSQTLTRVLAESRQR